MKKYCMLTLIILCCLSLMAQQKRINVNGVYYNLFYDGTAEVTNYAGGEYLENNRYSGNVIILPSVTDNGNVYRVTKIGKNAFMHSADLVSVNIPNRIKVIEERAFFECESLRNFVIPEGVEVIEDYAFFNDENLRTVSLPSTLKEMGRDAFGFCHTLDNVTLPEGLKIIKSQAFFDCWELHSINLPESVDSIQWGVFMASGIEKPVYNSRIFAYLPANYSGHYNVPYGIQIIAPSAFAMARELTSVSLPNSLKEIGGNAFGRHNGCWSDRYNGQSDNGEMGGCRKLTSIYIPNGVTKIGASAFRECESLVSVILPGSLACIGYGAFTKCTNLTSIRIPDSITKIESCAFQGCYNLTSISIGNSVREIGYSAFEGCRNAIGVEVPNNVTKIGSDAFKDIPYIMYSGTASGRPWGAGVVCQ